jgi:hypothetical protein
VAVFQQLTMGTVTCINTGAFPIVVSGDLSNVWSQIGDDEVDWTDVRMRNAALETPSVVEGSFLPAGLPPSAVIISAVPIVNIASYGGSLGITNPTSAFIGAYVGSFPFPPPEDWARGDAFLPSMTTSVHYNYSYPGVGGQSFPDTTDTWFDTPTIEDLNAGLFKIGAIGGYDPDVDNGESDPLSSPPPHYVRIYGARLDLTWSLPSEISDSVGAGATYRLRQREVGPRGLIASTKSGIQ